MKDQLLRLIRFIINPIGYDIVKYRKTHPSHIVLNHLKVHDIKTVLDIGANEGQYSINLRKAGFRGRIISFEPLNAAFQSLSGHSSADKNWQVYNFALGDKNSISSIHVSSHSPSSSILPMTRLHTEAAPGSEYVKEETIEIKKLDSIYSTLEVEDDRVFIKVDTQGYEKKVLDGAISTLPRITGIQLELSAALLYEGEETYYSICRFIEERGFHLVQVIPGFTHRTTNEMLQFDALFFRK
jgi:FkbM family methyltransferase